MSLKQSQRKNAQTNFYEFGYLPTNCTIAIVTPNDLDLLVQGDKIEMLSCFCRFAHLYGTCRRVALVTNI